MMQYLISIFSLIFVLITTVEARNLGQWEDTDPQIRQWYQSLMQPDTYPEPKSCCGEGDGYWADEIHVRTDRDGNQHIIAKITDDRNDEKLQRFHEEIGTEYEIPPNKIVGKIQKAGNPTGHTIIFLGTVSLGVNSERANPRPVLCFISGEAY